MDNMMDIKRIKPMPLPDTPEARASYDAFLLELAEDPVKFNDAVSIVTQILDRRKANMPVGEIMDTAEKSAAEGVSIGTMVLRRKASTVKPKYAAHLRRFQAKGYRRNI